MNWKDGVTTSPTLLGRLGDWRDHGAWLEFVGRYDPLIRLWSRRFNLDADANEELCQQIWMDVARRMHTYTYDPSLTFRGWLRRISYSRAVDLLRTRRSKHVHLLGDLPDQADSGSRETIEVEPDESNDQKRLLLLRLGKQVQDAVKSRVEPQTWLAFWRVAVEDRTVRETGDALGMSYAAAFAAHKRVMRMLRDEGRQLLNDAAITEKDIVRTGDQSASS
jgi:RNA polymerase sigma factor (sigma-70 family)